MLPAMTVLNRRRIEKGHRMDGAGSAVEAAAERPDKSASVFLAERAVEQEIARRIH